MEVVTICLSRPKEFKWGSWSIMKYQGMRWKDPRSYSHILAIIPDQDVGELILQASHGLVHSCNKEFFLEENEIVKSFTIPKEKLKVDWMKKQLGKKYGKMQIVKLTLKYFTGIMSSGNGNRKFICSEFVGKGLGQEWVNDYTDPQQVANYLEGIKC